MRLIEQIGTMQGRDRAIAAGLMLVISLVLIAINR